MDNPLHSQTITLTCGKLTTGVTVKPWCGIFMLTNMKSPETYFQAAFRVQSPWTAKGDNGEVYLFRPDMNAKRANNSNKRLCIPSIPEEDFVQAVKAVVDIDRDWIPDEPGTSLYIRPFVISTDDHLGVAPSKSYLFMVILSPSGAYYESGLAPVGIWIEDDYVRAVRGGIGFAKSREDNLRLLEGYGRLSELGYPLLLGASRKSLFGGRVEERLAPTLAATKKAVRDGVMFVRVHDVKENVLAIKEALADGQGHN